MKLDRYRTRAGLAVAATLPLVAGALALGIPSAQADSHSRQVLVNTKPLWATAKADHGAASGSTTVNARVYLAGSDAKGLAAYAQAVSDPNSASYGKYLTDRQVQARFGATKQQVAEVTGWLKSSGLKVTATTAHYIAISGDKAAVEKAFNTELHNYTKSGHTYHAPSTAASVPASLNGAVLTVTGLDNAPAIAQTDSTTGDATADAVKPSAVTPGDTLPPPDAVFKNAGPFSTYYGSKTDKSLPAAYGTHEPYAIKGYTGQQLRAAYGAKGYTGKGVTVAITDAYASPYIAQDAAKYAKRNGDAAYKAGQFTQVLPTDFNSTDECGASGWYGEETLDVESVHAVAPAADITYVGAASCFDNDLLDALSKVVDNHLADIVSNSWSDIEADSTPDTAAAYDQVFEQGAVEGIGFYFSTGDDGDYLAATGSLAGRHPGRLAVGDRGRRHLAGRGQERQVRVGDRLGHREGAAGRGRPVLDRLPRPVHLGRGRRHQRAVRAAVLPEGCRADLAQRGQRRHLPDARAARHLGGRGPDHRFPGRPVADLP